MASIKNTLTVMFALAFPLSTGAVLPGDGGAALYADQTSAIVSGPIMQEEPDDHPIWAALREMQRGPAEWAQLLIQDTDANGRTDFLDLTAGLSYLDPSLNVELLVYGDADARDSLRHDVPGAVDIGAIDAVFLVWPLTDIDSLDRPGIELMVWEPRAHVAGDTNPAGGSHASMLQHQRHEVDRVWDDGYTGSGVKIAILDSGVRADHDAFSASGKIASFHDCVNSISSAYDDNGHGTHVASIAAGNDGGDFRGTAYEAQIVAVKVFNENGTGNLSDFWCGLGYVNNTGGTPRADVASFSGSLKTPQLRIATLNGGALDVFGWDRAARTLPVYRDIPFTNSAGNHPGVVLEVHGTDESMRVGVNGVNQVGSPAFADEVIAVGATDRHRSMAHFSALGPGKTASSVKPDVVAMGVEVWGALHTTTDEYEQWDGTSMSAPIVAGTIALMMDKDPSHTAVDYADILRDHATSTCIATLSQQQCSIQGVNTEKRFRPNTIDGYGLIHAEVSVDRTCA